MPSTAQRTTILFIRAQPSHIIVEATTTILFIRAQPSHIVVESTLIFTHTKPSSSLLGSIEPN